MSKPICSSLYCSLLVATFFLTYFFYNLDALNASCFETGDYASNAIAVIRASHFEQLTGPYSRFHFYHPGPFFFYAYALAENLFGSLTKSHFAIHTIAQLFLHMFFAALTLHAIFRGLSDTASRTLKTTLYFFCLLFCLYPLSADLYSNTWGPAASVMPFALFITSAVAVSLGNAALLPLLVIGASCAIHPHVGTISVIVPMSIVSIGLLIKSHGLKKLFEQKTSLILATIFVLTINLPIISDLIRNGLNANLFKILAFVQSSSIQHAFTESLLFSAKFYSEQFFETDGLIGLLVFLSFAIVSTFSKQAYIKRLAIFSILSFLLSVIATLKAQGELYNHLMWYQYVLVANLMFTSISTILEVAHSKFKLDITSKFTYSSLTFCLLLMPYVAIRKYPINTNNLCNQAPKKLFAKLSPSKERIYKFDASTRWGTATGLALYMLRNEYLVCVNDSWTFMFGAELSCDVIFKKDSHKLTKLTFRKNNKYKRDVPSNAIVHNKTLLVVKDYS